MTTALPARAFVTAGYLNDNVGHAAPGSAAMPKARSDAADVVRALTGVNARRVHLTDGGISIDDQLPP